MHGLAALIAKGAHATPLRPGNHQITALKRTALHQNGGYRATALVELRFDNRTFCGAIRIGLEVQNFRLQQDGFKQRIQIGALFSRNGHP